MTNHSDANAHRSPSSPLVSVIIPSFNCARYLEEAVKSILDQTFRNWECIIVDDGSTDHTRTIGEYLAAIDSRVKYIYQENGGAASARNLGVEVAQGRWIQFLDADDLLHKHKIQFQLDYLLQAGYSNRSEIVLYSDLEAIFIAEDHRIFVNTAGCSTREDMLARLISPFAIQSGCLLINKRIFDRIKFDTRIAYIEDAKHQVDMLMDGVDFIYTPTVGLSYRIHQSNMTSGHAGYDSWSPKQRDYFIRYLEIIQQEYPNLKALCQAKLIEVATRAIKFQERENFQRVLSLIDIPIRLYGIQLTSKWQFQLIYEITSRIPRTVLRTMFLALKNGGKNLIYLLKQSNRFIKINA